jgi:hypothetical protein
MLSKFNIETPGLLEVGTVYTQMLPEVILHNKSFQNTVVFFEQLILLVLFLKSSIILQFLSLL